MKLLTILLLVLSITARAEGSLSSAIRISSEVLGYDLQYRVYVPDGIANPDNLPVLYVTDGPGYISQGRMPQVLDKLIDGEDIEPVVVVFVDARDPDRSSVNRRNSQFLCNLDYLAFYETELMPRIEQEFPVGTSREHRGILGLSFGGTNAACFGLFGSDSFANVGMHSPANHPVRELLPAYEDSPRLPLRMFLSTGKPNDNTEANRRFRRVLESKNYELMYIEVRAGHNWDNWRPLVDDVLLYFYALEGDPPSDM